MRKPLTPERRALLQGRLEQAENALHDLLMGNTTVSVAYEGESVTFRQTDEAKLRRYIAELEAELGLVRSARRRVSA